MKYVVSIVKFDDANTRNLLLELDNTRVVMHAAQFTNVFTLTDIWKKNNDSEVLTIIKSDDE